VTMVCSASSRLDAALTSLTIRCRVSSIVGLKPGPAGDPSGW
jgi:hypothetical protein